MKQIPAALLKEYLEYRERGSCTCFGVPLEDMPRDELEAMLYHMAKQNRTQLYACEDFPIR